MSQVNQAAVSAAWTTAKAQLATIQADAATLCADLAALEPTITTLFNLGASDVAETRIVFSATCQGARAYPFAEPVAEQSRPLVTVIFQLSEGGLSESPLAHERRGCYLRPILVPKVQRQGCPGDSKEGGACDHWNQLVLHVLADE